jgi:hypothetical protein
MKVKDLIKELSKLDPEWVVVLSSDEEGNSFSELSDLETNAVFADREIHLRELTKDLEKQGFSDEDVYDGNNGKNAVVLYP